MKEKNIVVNLSKMQAAPCLCWTLCHGMEYSCSWHWQQLISSLLVFSLLALATAYQQSTGFLSPGTGNSLSAVYWFVTSLSALESPCLKSFKHMGTATLVLGLRSLGGAFCLLARHEFLFVVLHLPLRAAVSLQKIALM